MGQHFDSYCFGYLGSHALDHFADRFPLLLDIRRSRRVHSCDYRADLLNSANQVMDILCLGLRLIVSGQNHYHSLYLPLEQRVKL